MLAEERKTEIINLIAQKNIVKVVELSKLFNATEATIRRDLDELQKRKKLRRVHGGAVSLKPTSKILSDNELSALCMTEKKLIAQKAYEFIDDNDSVIFDASTTVLELAKLIATGNKKNLSIVTNSFNVVSVLSQKKDIHVLHVGGQVQYSMHYSIGSITENVLKNLRVDKCFLGTNGIDIEYGYSVPSFEDASTKKYMLKSSKQKFILADHTKFGATYMGNIVGFSGEIDYLITDSIPQTLNRDLYDSHVNLIIATPT